MSETGSEFQDAVKDMVKTNMVETEIAPLGSDTKVEMEKTEYDKVLEELGLVDGQNVNATIKEMVEKVFEYLKGKGGVEGLKALKRSGLDSKQSLLAQIYSKILLENHIGSNTTDQGRKASPNTDNGSVQRVVIEVVGKGEGPKKSSKAN